MNEIVAVILQVLAERGEYRKGMDNAQEYVDDCWAAAKQEIHEFCMAVVGMHYVMVQPEGNITIEPYQCLNANQA